MPDLAAQLKKEQLDRDKADARRREVAQAKAELFRKKEEARLKKEAEEKFWRENEALRAKIEKERADEAERVRKTKTYFKLDPYSDTQFQIAMNPTYFGEHITDTQRKESWVPHGEGKFIYGDDYIIKGTYDKGFLHGHGHQIFEDESSYEGEFKKGRMEGVGVYTEKIESPSKNSPEKVSSRECLMRDNIILCYKDDLQQGTQIEFDDPTLFVVTMNRRPRASIMYHERGWKYKVHWHDEIKPRERSVVFSSIKKFKVLSHLPKIYFSNALLPEIQNDPPKRYDYFKDVYGHDVDEPKLGITGNRRDINMKPLNVVAKTPAERNKYYKKNIYKKNVFESAAVGVGAAAAEEEKERLQEVKRKQFEDLIEKRREEAEAEKQAAIEAEQKRALEEETANKKSEREAEKKEKEAEQIAMQKAIKEAQEAAERDIKF
jgi:hypothetical protein